MDKIKLNIIIIISILIILCLQSVYANERINYEIQAGKMIYYGLHDRLSHSPGKWMIGTGVIYYLTPFLELDGNLSYQYLSFDPTNVDLDYLLHADGQSGQLYEACLGFRLTAPFRLLIQPYLVLQAGYDVIYFGKETYTTMFGQYINPGIIVRNFF